jgi:MOSC domain-containing protein YiiM
MVRPDLILATLSSIQVATPATYGFDGADDPHEMLWTTGFFKRPVSGPVFASATNLRGDGQADLENHGGIDKAVLAYSADHYPNWRDELNMPEMPHGAFGENLTIAGLSEESVCIGDVLRIGPVTFEVSQPRQPCWKLARRWRMHTLPGLVVGNGRTGWYLRVLEEGYIENGMPVALIERPNPEWQIERANHILYHSRTDLPLTVALAGVPGLSNSWAEGLLERAERLRAATVSS